MSSKTRFVVITSDNLDKCMVTNHAYQRIRLEMSTGDFHTHQFAEIEPEAARILKLSLFDFVSEDLTEIEY